MMYDELVKALRDDNVCLSIKTAHEAADAIEELQQTVEHYKGCADDWYKEACDYKAAVPTWIPVTERLPEPDVPCLCWCKGGEYSQIRWYGLYYLTSHGKWAIYDNDFIDNKEVTHWMYRPEPPKEETE